MEKCKGYRAPETVSSISEILTGRRKYIGKSKMNTKYLKMT